MASRTLRHVTDELPGITRHGSGRRFTYRWPDGRPVRDPETLARIRALVIPPAWQHVWICPTPSGHIQAVGRDARGRKQYRYHAAWITQRDEAKYGRMIPFGEALPRLRRQVARDLQAPPLSRRRVLATVVRLLERTLIRIGNEEYARTNGSFGLTTLQTRHVKVRGSHLEFKFRAKSGVLQQIELDDPTLAASVKRLQELPGQTLFQYVDSDGRTLKLGSGDVNQYVRQAMGRNFTAKDFRTWFGTVLAAMALEEVAAAQPPATSKTAMNRNVVAAIDRVKEALGNTRAVCRRCYIHPAVLDAYFHGETIQATGKAPASWGLTPAERSVLALLRKGSRRRPRTGLRHTERIGAVA